MRPTLADAQPPITVSGEKSKPLELAAATAVLLLVGAAFTALPPAGEPLRAAVRGPEIHCAPATWLLDTQANPTTGDTTTTGSTVYTVQVLKSPCYGQLTDGDTPNDGWVGGVATTISEHTDDWQTLAVALDFSTVTLSSTLTEVEMHAALEVVTGYVEWGVWESARAEETGPA